MMMPIVMLHWLNSDLSERIVVRVPAPAISGKAKGTIEVVSVSSGFCLNK